MVPALNNIERPELPVSDLPERPRAYLVLNLSDLFRMSNPPPSPIPPIPSRFSLLLIYRYLRSLRSLRSNKNKGLEMSDLPSDLSDNQEISMTGIHENSITEALSTMPIDRYDRLEGFSQLDLLRRLHLLGDMATVLLRAGWRLEGKQWFPPRSAR